LEDSYQTMQNTLPVLAKWKKDRAASFDPKSNIVQTENGDTIQYEYLVVATGIETHYDAIPGLVDALKVPKGPVSSIYSPLYVNRVYESFQAFKNGNAIFTFPSSPVKCPGAPQKICYIFEHYLRRNKKRQGAKIFYNTSLPNIFGVKHYADALWKVAKKRDITVNVRTNLVEILPNGRQAIFENLDTKERATIDFNLLHVTPPMSTPLALRKNAGDLVNDAGFVDVNKYSMQHVKYENIFAIGDCSSSPNSKTAAAAAAQCQVVYKNLMSVIEERPLERSYDGYASCPLVTGYSSCILAEFDYDLKPLESFPIEQAKERYSMFVLKKNFMPFLYWHVMMNGLWNGPAILRKGFDLFRNKNI
jgi:eukaryotic sulfide quinone oxidoreductase